MGFIFVHKAKTREKNQKNTESNYFDRQYYISSIR